MSERKETATDRYKKKTIKQFKFELNRNTDAELLEWFEAQPNKQGLIKALLKKEMGAK